MRAPAPVLARLRFPVWLVAILLVLLTIGVYWPAASFDFINCDDPLFGSENPHVQGGLTWAGVKWAFQLYGGDYWHPLTWLSLMLDVSLFGQQARGFHFTNVAFHAVNSLMVFLLLRLLTRAFWRSVMVAALFAVHPLRVESVAWVTERKDVLSAFFGFLSLLFYARYAAVQSLKSKVQSRNTTDYGPLSRLHAPGSTLHATLFYLLSLCSLALGLMSKAMLVTWPCVMLLLDYWPLQRLQPALSKLKSSARKLPPSSFLLPPLLLEKLPFLVLSAISCVITYLTEKGTNDPGAVVGFPALLRLENALVACARYLGKTLWPAKLAVPYTHLGHWSWLEVGASAGVVVGVCLVALWLGSCWPYLLVGWCWFWGTLIPVLGLTKGWVTFMGDRFTYVPSVGVLLLVVWGACELTRCWRYQVMALSVAGSVAIVLCLALTRQQLGYWKDSETLFRHALEVTENNYLAHDNLGAALDKEGQTDEAIRQYQEALRLKPDFTDAHNNLGAALAKKGRTDEAIRQFQEVIRLKPDQAVPHHNLGNAALEKGQTDEAIRQFQEAIRLRPGFAEAHNDLGTALGLKGQTDEAIRQFQEAIRLRPDNAEAHNNLGTALGLKGQTDEAIRQFQEALRLKPDLAGARKILNALLAAKAQASPPPGAAGNR